MPTLVTSSPGDFDRMGVLGRWNSSVQGQPSSAEQTSVDARVTDVSLAVRIGTFAYRVAEYLQFDGRLRILLFNSSKWERQGDLDELAETVRNWIRRICVE